MFSGAVDRMPGPLRKFSSHFLRLFGWKMAVDWDERARRNPLYYIATGRADWDENSFFATGRKTVEEQVLNDMTNICQGKDPKAMRVLEVGCGVGRVTRWLADLFGEVHAVDVSHEMIRRAREFLAGYENVHLYRNSGVDLAVLGDRRFDFAFSFLVFQHVPSKQILENYARDLHERLVPGALFKFQLAGSPLRSRRLLGWWDTWHGVSFTRGEVEALAERCGFEARYLVGEGTQYFWVWFFRR